MINHYCDKPQFDISEDIAELAHYQVKTKDEWIERKYKHLDGIFTEQNKTFSNFETVMKWFNSRNRNEIENTLIYDIMYEK